jgi:hypothetical protein
VIPVQVREWIYHLFVVLDFIGKKWQENSENGSFLPAIKQ